MSKLQLRDDDALVLVDVQNDFCSGGTLPVPGADEIILTANRLVTMFRHVVLTQDWHPLNHQSFASSHPGKKPYDTIRVSYGKQILWPDHCVGGTPGADFHSQLQTERARFILRKGIHPDTDSYSAFLENDRKITTGLAEFLKGLGIHRVYLAGLATDFGVYYSAVDARDLGFKVCVIEDAVRGMDVDGSLERAWIDMAKLNIERILHTDIVIF